jgi:hypothetical protein
MTRNAHATAMVYRSRRTCRIKAEQSGASGGGGRNAPVSVRVYARAECSCPTEARRHFITSCRRDGNIVTRRPSRYAKGEDCGKNMGGRVTLGEFVAFVLFQRHTDGASDPGGLFSRSAHRRPGDWYRTLGQRPDVEQSSVLRKLGPRAGNGQVIGPDQFMPLTDVYGHIRPSESGNPFAELEHGLGGRGVHYMPR